MITDFLYVL